MTILPEGLLPAKLRRIQRNTTVGFNHLLTVGAQNVIYKILRNLRQVFFGRDVERTGKDVAAILNAGSGGSHAADLRGLNRIVQRTKRDVADGVFIAGNAAHNRLGSVDDDRLVSGVVGLVPVRVLGLDSGQLNKSIAGARALFCGRSR